MVAGHRHRLGSKIESERFGGKAVKPKKNQVPLTVQEKYQKLVALGPNFCYRTEGISASTSASRVFGDTII